MSADLSKTKVARAGVTLVDYLQNNSLAAPVAEGEVAPSGRVVPSPSDAMRAVLLVDEWRASHARALGEITAGLRSFSTAKRCGLAEPVGITQRHKRLESIILKLAREDGKSKLARLEDIGGCRVVFQSREDLWRMHAHIVRTWGMCKSNRVVKRERDYINLPRVSGYRAVHVIVQHRERRVEIQLRTAHMHDWADNVERVGRSYGWQDLKAGIGPGEILKFFHVVAAMNECDEIGAEIPEELQKLYDQEFAAASAYATECRKEQGHG